MRNLCAFVVLRVAAAAIVQPLPGVQPLAGPMTLEAVPLLTTSPSTEQSPVVRKASRELLKSLGYDRDPDLDVVSQEYARHRDDNQADHSTEVDYYDDTTPIPTSSLAPVKISRRQGFLANTNSPENRTKLYPVGRLWDWARNSQKRTEEQPEETEVSTERAETSAERTLPPRPMGMMALLDAAFSCLWSGLGFECFSLKVVPMFRAMMGFPPVHPFGHPYYVLPRTTDTDVQKSQEDDDEEDEENEEDETGKLTGPAQGGSKVLLILKGRRRRRTRFGLKMLKMGLMGLAALKTFLVPAFSVMSIASGKAIVFSLAAVVLTLAVSWSAARSAERRVYETQPPPPYYM